MNYDHILVVTYGRSGSTLLQGVLNSLGGVTIRGENTNFCFGLYITYLSLLRSKVIAESIPSNSAVTPDKPESPWYGADKMSAVGFIKDARALAVKQWSIPSFSHCSGFKEIRYFDVFATEFTKDSLEVLGLNHDPKGRLFDYLDFLKILFDSCALVFLSRDPQEVIKSGWWRDMDQTSALSVLYEYDKAIDEYVLSRSDCFRLDYDDLRQATNKLINVMEGLGGKVNIDELRSVLGRPHSYKT